MSGRPLLRSEVHETELARSGFTRIDLLTLDEIAALRDVHDRHHPDAGIGFDTDFAYLAPAHKREVDAEIRRVVGAAVARAFEGVRLFNVTFVVKWPDDSSALPLHQDWSYVDETEHRSVVVWIALDDTSPVLDNGPLFVLPGSHRIGLEHRGTMTAPWHLEHADELRARSIPVTVRAGQAAILDNRLLHWSPPNATDDMRLAFAMAVTDADAPLQHSTLVEPGVVTVHQVGPEFFEQGLDGPCAVLEIPDVRGVKAVPGAADDRFPVARDAPRDPALVMEHIRNLVEAKLRAQYVTAAGEHSPLADEGRAVGRHVHHGANAGTQTNGCDAIGDPATIAAVVVPGDDGPIGPGVLGDRVADLWRHRQP